MPERLCRFIPLQKKVEMIILYNEHVGKLIKGFIDIKNEATDFRKHYDVETKLRRDNSMDYARFYSYICKEIRAV